MLVLVRSCLSSWSCGWESSSVWDYTPPGLNQWRVSTPNASHFQRTMLHKSCSSNYPWARAKKPQDQENLSSWWSLFYPLQSPSACANYINQSILFGCSVLLYYLIEVIFRPRRLLYLPLDLSIAERKASSEVQRARQVERTVGVNFIDVAAIFFWLGGDDILW